MNTTLSPRAVEEMRRAKAGWGSFEGRRGVLAEIRGVHVRNKGTRTHARVDAEHGECERQRTREQARARAAEQQAGGEQ